MKCPCKSCITLAVCKSKDYHGRAGLLHICKELCEYLSIQKNSRIHKKRIKKLYKIMKPLYWQIGEETVVGFNILRKGNK